MALTYIVITITPALVRPIINRMKAMLINSTLPKLQIIQRATHTAPAFIQYMRVNHGGTYIRVA